MDPIKNNGAMDYTMTMPQQNNVQPTQEEDYSSMPMVYDPTMDEKKESAKSGVALKALAAIGIAGLAMWVGHYRGSKGVKTLNITDKNGIIKAFKIVDNTKDLIEDYNIKLLSSKVYWENANKREEYKSCN